jgi:alpha-tubulin suppressor-like RCC1 family protein
MRPLALIALCLVACGNLKTVVENDGGTGGGSASGGGSAGGGVATGGGTSAGGGSAVGGGAATGGGSQAGGGTGTGGGSSDGGLCPVGSYSCPSGCCKAIAVGAGDAHSCLVTSDGNVKCWGAFYANGTTSEIHKPHDVSGIVGATAVVGGWTHSCALFSADGGTVKCWGINANGSLGNSSHVPSASPVDVSNLNGVTGLASGGSFNCALANGGVYCWGYGSMGEMGDNSGADRDHPGPVSGLVTGVIGVTAGADHACAVKQDGSVQCWGANIAYQLGAGTQSQQENLPVSVVYDAGFDTLSAGLNDTFGYSLGAWLCWGGNSNGQCGTSAGSLDKHPVPVDGAPSGPISAGPLANHGCIGVPGGGLSCWGLNDHGQLGDNSVQSRSQLMPVLDIGDPVVSIAVGSHHTCVALSTGGVKCWGFNMQGQVGDNSTQDRWSPVDVLDQ